MNNQDTEINFCPCCGTNLRAVSLALGFAANPTPATAREVGCAKNTVRNIISRLRPELLPSAKNPALSRKAKRTPITTEEREKVGALQKQGKKAAAIAAELKMPLNRVNSIYYKH